MKLSSRLFPFVLLVSLLAACQPAPSPTATSAPTATQPLVVTAWPLELPDGSLQYFYASAADQPAMGHALFMVRPAADGVSGRTQLRPDAFGSLGEALWAPGICCSGGVGLCNS